MNNNNWKCNSPTTTTTPLLINENRSYSSIPSYLQERLHQLTSSERINDDDNSVASASPRSRSLQSSYRRPFHIPHDHNGRHHHLDNDLDISITYNRYKYYTRLNGRENDKFKIPDHVVPYYFYLPQVPWGLLISTDSNEITLKKQNSFVTIFAIWNLMMGTSLLVLPWALQKTGLITGIALIFFMTLICFYTANLVISIPKLVSIEIHEFTDAVDYLLGKWAYGISLFSSLTTITGGCIVYWVLMSNFLYYSGTFVYLVSKGEMEISKNMSEVICFDNKNSSNTTNDELFNKYWDLHSTVPFVLAILLGPVITLKSVNIFMKFNVVGSLSVIYLILFSMYKSWQWGVLNVNFTDSNSMNYVPLYTSEFFTMTGVLSLALFIHNFIISLLSTQQNPENNKRDLGIAYILVCITYLAIALLIYLGFPIDKSCLQDNFLNNLVSNDILAFLTRIFLLIQIVALYPLLVYMLRIQVMNLFLPNSSPSYHHIIILNVLLLTLCIAFAIYFPRIGTIIRYVGSFSGLIFIFAFPPLTYLKAKKFNGQQISMFQTVFHYSIILIGICNCFGQFFIT